MSDKVLLDLMHSVDNVIINYEELKKDNEEYIKEILRLETENDTLVNANNELLQCQNCDEMPILLEELYEAESEIANLKSKLNSAEKIAKLRLNVITCLDGGAYETSIKNIDRG